eukprot:TRINITY_DN26655_c0_g1_i1.p2 TRINITY_DN26655_c0_g1~~TRINITY_DN26655_c0_g1_i1.p2  ORF type:complete len:294 (-),score=50.31 TRINITY_DN26655_c0_g1_i1:83-964(-)
MSATPVNNRMRASVSDSALRSVGVAKPGGPWVFRGNKKALPALGKSMASEPPENEASRMAWEASRKATLHGILGTGNRISSVVQYPVASRDPLNMCQGRKNHLSAEDRRILRVRIKYHLRRQRGTHAFADAVYMMEKIVLKGFSEDESLVKAFYQNEDFADKFLETCATTVERSLLSGVPEQTTTFKVRLGPKPATPEGVPPPCGHAGHPVHVIPGHHSHDCSPMCYCLKFQDTPLSMKGDMRKQHDWLWEPSFADKSKTAAQGVIDRCASLSASSLRHHAHDVYKAHEKLLL